MEYFIVIFGIFIALFIIRGSFGDVRRVQRIEFSAAEMTGKRQINADEFDWAYFGEELFFALADGIGPGEKAQTAAKVAVRIVTRVFEQTGLGANPAYFFMNAFRGANATVMRYIPDGGAGASLLAAAVKENFLYYALAGNCRICVFRGGELYDLSEGHTFDVLAGRAFQRGKISRIDALEAVKESRIYNFVGKDGFTDLEMFDTPVALKRGDILLMMTDGVYDSCPTGTLAQILNSRDPERVMAKNIIDTIKQCDNSEQDNATVIVARVNTL